MFYTLGVDHAARAQKFPGDLRKRRQRPVCELKLEKVAIILRKSKAENRFREIILQSFQSNAFSALTICSGFFQERGTYFASSCFAARPPKWPCRKQVTTVGVYNGIWKRDFDSFAVGLGSIACSCGKSLPVTKRRVRGYHWHAKVFIASDANGPQLGVIGSSNITSRAFGIAKAWNFEADAVLWNEAHPGASKVIDAALAVDQDSDPGAIIVSVYDRNDPRNRGLSLQERLGQLLADIDGVSDVVE